MKKNDRWSAALADVLAERQTELVERFGRDEALRAFAAGELPEESADEVRELLALHPKLEAAWNEMAEPPAIGPGHPAHLSAEEQEAGWRDLTASLGLGDRRSAAKPARRPPWRVLVPLAAGLGAIAITLALRYGPGTPDPLEFQAIQADLRPRGGGSVSSVGTMVERRGEEFPLALELPRSFAGEDRFRVAVYDAEVPGGEPAWVFDGLASTAGDRLLVRIPGRSLSAGMHRLRVELMQPDGAGELVASYLVRVR